MQIFARTKHVTPQELRESTCSLDVLVETALKRELEEYIELNADEIVKRAIFSKNKILILVRCFLC